MKEICGFLDTQGRFHKTEEECEIAEIEIKLVNTRKTLERFDKTVSEYIFKEYRKYATYNPYENEWLLEIVTKSVLQNSDGFIAIINQKKELAASLDRLEQEYKNKEWKPWWLKLKWW